MAFPADSAKVHVGDKTGSYPFTLCLPFSTEACMETLEPEDKVKWMLTVLCPGTWCLILSNLGNVLLEIPSTYSCAQAGWAWLESNDRR